MQAQSVAGGLLPVPTVVTDRQRLVQQQELRMRKVICMLAALTIALGSAGAWAHHGKDTEGCQKESRPGTRNCH